MSGGGCVCVWYVCMLVVVVVALGEGRFGKWRWIGVGLVVTGGEEGPVCRDAVPGVRKP